MQVTGINTAVNFQRKPTKKEEVELKTTINKAYELIGAKERVVITHGSCFPSGYKNTGIGSPYSKTANEYIKFLSLYGFNGIQLGPVGLLEKGTNSPYKSSAFAKNRLFIDLEKLTTKDYDNILSTKTYKKVTTTPLLSKNNYTMSDFKKANKTYNIALKEAYNNFQNNIEIGKSQELKSEYNNFLKYHNKRLTEEGVFRVLSNKYDTDDYSKWSNNEDINLISNIQNGDAKAEKLFYELYLENIEQINQYKFEQFLAVKQIKENKEIRDKIGFKYINDLLAGCSKMDTWRYKDAFLEDWEMGAQEWNGVSQRWHIPVIDPKKIFINGDYDLNIGGKFLKEKIDFALEFYENIRVDHVMGLVEPYIMSKHAQDSDFIAYPSYLKNKDIEKYISELKNPDNPNEEYDLYWDYPKLLEKLVLPTFMEHGLDKNDPMWEDICTWPDRFKKVYNELDLPKTGNLDWSRASDLLPKEPNNWFILGNHDNIPVMNYMRRTAKLNNGEIVEYTRKQPSWNVKYLSEYLNQDYTRENIEEIKQNLEDLYNKDDIAITKAKFAILLTTPKFQISFDDLLGITDVIYNVPGKELPQNWKARISADYEDKYYQNLSSDNPTALNVPELLHTALQGKIDILVKEHNFDESYKSQIYEEYQPVLDKLQHFAEILKEP